KTSEVAMTVAPFVTVNGGVHLLLGTKGVATTPEPSAPNLSLTASNAVGELNVSVIVWSIIASVVAPSASVGLAAVGDVVTANSWITLVKTVSVMVAISP